MPLKNISELPLPVQPLVSDFSQKLLADLNGNIKSILVYGSAAGADYDHGTSNVNVAVIVKDLDLGNLSPCLKTIKWGHKNRMATPLILSEAYVSNAFDVFPIEFSDIKRRHKVIFGEDFFSGIDIPLKDVRLLCEQQVKGKLLHLRQAYLETGANPVVLKNLLSSALRDLIPVFGQLLVLKGLPPEENKEKLFEAVSRTFSLDADAFVAVLNDKTRRVLIAPRQVEAYLQSFLSQLEKLSRHLDSL